MQVRPSRMQVRPSMPHNWYTNVRHRLYRVPVLHHEREIDLRRALGNHLHRYRRQRLEYAGRDAGRVGIAVFRHHGVAAELVGDIGAARRRDVQLLRLFEFNQLVSACNIPAVETSVRNMPGVVFAAIQPDSESLLMQDSLYVVELWCL